MNIGITRFLGTNCDQDVWKAVAQMGHTPQWLWYRDNFDIETIDAVIVPGGFSHGDYLRAGALAARQPVMTGVRKAAAKGLPVLGICNGMQILCESGLLPGTMVRNERLRFVDQWVELELAHVTGSWDGPLSAGVRVRLPIAHGEGRFYAEENELKRLQDQQAVWLKYVGPAPNGSLAGIAGVKAGSVAALMPHPERAMDEWMGGSDGQAFFQGFN
jgi:phosphoribosylformylglycinamidine synthase